MTDLVIFLLSLLGIVFGTEAAGFWICKRVNFIPADPPLVVRWGIGWIGLTWVLILLGIFGIFVPAAQWGILVVLLVSAFLRMGFSLPDWFTQGMGKIQEDEVFQFFRICAIVMLALCFAGVLTPETRHDPYDYHLTIPTLYLAYGRIVEIPWHVFTYMPKNGEILYGLALGVGNDSIAKLIHYGMGALCVLIVASFIRRIAGLLAGWIAGVLILTLPLFGFLSTSAYVDLTRSFWELLALFCLALYGEDSNQNEKTYGWLILSALFAGMALGTKYVAWLIFLPPYLLCCGFLWFYSDQKFPKRLWLVFPLISILPVTPWLGFNLLWTRNPFYPLFPAVFGMHIPAAESAYTFFRSHAPSAETYTVFNSFYYLFIRINRLILDGNALVLLGAVGLLTAAMWRKNQVGSALSRRVYWGLVIYITGSGLLFFLGADNQDGRFWFTSLALLAIPTTFFLLFLEEKLKTYTKMGEYVILIVGLVLFVNGLTYRFSQLTDLRETVVPVVTDFQRDEWLDHHFPTYPVVRWANQNLPSGALVLGMGYPLRCKHISNVKCGYLPFFENLPSPLTPKILAEILETNGITHVVKPYPRMPYSVDFSLLEESYLEPVFRYRGTILYRLRAVDRETFKPNDS